MYLRVDAYRLGLCIWAPNAQTVKSIALLMMNIPVVHYVVAFATQQFKWIVPNKRFHVHALNPRDTASVYLCAG